MLRLSGAKEAIEVSRSVLTQILSSKGSVTYQIEVEHPGLKKHRVLKDRDPDMLERRAALQLEQWEEQWAKKLARQAAADARAAAQREKEHAQQEALHKTHAAQQRLAAIENTLHHALAQDNALDWDSLEDSSVFSAAPPKAVLPPEPKLHDEPPEPYTHSDQYKPSFSLFDKLSSRRRDARQREARERYDSDLREWRRVKRANILLEREYKEELARAATQHEADLVKWRDARQDHLAQQQAWNSKLVEHRRRWQAYEESGIEAWCALVLSRSLYDECCPQEFALEYNRANRILIVDYQLPAPDAMPTLAEVKYVISRKEFTEKRLPIAQQRKMYDSLLYQITLRTLHELFEADTINALDAAVFNGFVTSIDKGTGREATACVLSVQANRDEFAELHLEQVEPKACFRRLKGVGSTKLHSVTPVAPLHTLNRDDSRFVADQDVMEALDEGDNLAAMDWEEFEHLIREVFSEEFSGEGGEVKVTQASRDGGVDAVAFDPDPIRGGKIVIQAKRYTNTVGVSAVRDLYGTVVNEGAMKGILVTTSSYGPDAYAFATDKPITLLDGGHLLHLLERHGRKAKIDLAEAKKLMS